MKPQDMTMDVLKDGVARRAAAIAEREARYAAGEVPTPHLDAYVYADLLDPIAELEARTGQPWARALDEPSPSVGRWRVDQTNVDGYGPVGDYATKEEALAEARRLRAEVAGANPWGYRYHVRTPWPGGRAPASAARPPDTGRVWYADA